MKIFVAGLPYDMDDAELLEFFEKFGTVTSAKVAIDKETGKVTGAQMLESTGSKLLDGAALQAYSQWRFKPGSVRQLKIPIEFRNRPPTPVSTQRAPSILVSLLLILFGFSAAMMLARRRRTSPIARVC